MAALADGVLRAFWVQKATAAAAGLAVVFTLGAAVGLSVRDAPGVAQEVPTAPPPREKAAPARTVAEMEEEVRYWSDRAAWSRRMTARAEAEVESAVAARRRATDGFGLGVETAQDLEAARAAEQAAKQRWLAAGRMASADADRLQVAEDRLAFTTRRNGADVTGTIAVDVTFPDLARGRVAVAAIDLIRGGFTEPAADMGRDVWDAARRGAHVHLRFPTPYRPAPLLLKLEWEGMLMAELVVPLPLTREPGGFVLVRDVGRVVRVGKLPAEACVRFQEALAGAVPAGR